MPKLNRLFYYISFSIILVSFFMYLVKNQNHFSIPNGDLFQYIGDGYQYLNFKLPESIHPPPFAPVSICLLANLLKGLVEYPELTSVHIIIITLSTLSLLNIFLLLFPHSPFTALTTVVLLATNQIYINNSLNVTNEIVYLYFLTLTLLLYQKKQSWYVYLLSGFLFLIRYESVVLPLAIFTVEFFYNRKQLKGRNLLLAFSPIVIWLIILNFHSAGTSIIQNAYVQEIICTTQKIPNLTPINSLPQLIFFNYYQKFYLLTFIIFILFILEIVNHKSSKTIKITFLVFIFHNLFLSLFPNYYPRYHLSVIWIFYLLIINRHNTLIKILIFFVLFTYNISQIKKPYALDNPTEGKEYILSANWINKQIFNYPVEVYIYDPVIIKYYVHNPKVSLNFRTYFDTNIFTTCHNQISCVIQKQCLNSSCLPENEARSLTINTPLKIFVITTSSSSISLKNISDQYTAYKHHLLAFHNIHFLNGQNHFKLITILGNDKNWAKIYEYIP